MNTSNDEMHDFSMIFKNKRNYYFLIYRPEGHIFDEMHPFLKISIKILEFLSWETVFFKISHSEYSTIKKRTVPALI